jgi:aspartyl/asparaginyl beta-hydroxylase (cupin superfamily)
MERFTYFLKVAKSANQGFDDYLHNLRVLSNCKLGKPEINRDDAYFNLNKRQDCHPEPVEGQTVYLYHLVRLYNFMPFDRLRVTPRFSKCPLQTKTT